MKRVLVVEDDIDLSFITMQNLIKEGYLVDQAYTCAKAQEIRERNFCVASDGTTPDNGHPNTAAHEFESTFIEAWLRTL